MAAIIDNALNECRILVLVTQVFLGFQFESVFESGFERLPRYAQFLKLGGLGLMLITLCALLSPSAYHRIAENGDLSQKLNRFITVASERALVPFALGLSIDVYVVAARILGRIPGLTIAFSALIVALFFWYGIGVIAADTRVLQKGTGTTLSYEPTSLDEKIKFVLVEARVVLPGTQALLGFQFTAVLMDPFDKLLPAAQHLHLASIIAIGLSTILLMAPAAYHRIALHGANSESLHAFASWMIMGAMFFLALGIAGDVFVVVEKGAHSIRGAWFSSGAALLTFLSAWFISPLCKRARRIAPAS